MKETYNRILPYDSAKRNIRWREHFGEGLAKQTLDHLIGELKHIQERLLGCTESSICREIGELTRYRVMLKLLPESCLFGNPLEEKPLIRQHLKNIGIDVDEQLVSAIKVVCSNYRASLQNPDAKLGIEDVRVKYPKLFDEIMERQNSRCQYCGELINYGVNAQLDHVMPWAFGDDPGDGANWCFACTDCNVGKSNFPYYSLTEAVSRWVQESDSARLRIRFAALARDRCCVICGTGPRHRRLIVRKVVSTGCWILDNVRSCCEEHCKPEW